MALTPQQLASLVLWRQIPANAALSQADAVTLANTPLYTPVPYPTFQSAVMQLACWGSVRAAAANLSTYPAALQPVILTAVDLFTSYKAPNVDLKLQAFQQALSALEQAGLVSASDAAAILALGQSLPAGAAVALADVQAADAVIAHQATVAALVAGKDAGEQSLASLISTFANGPVDGTPPTDLQQLQQFAAGAFPGRQFTITGG